MSRSWTIGARPDCDLVVNLPKVSGRHCRLTLDESGYSVEDLNSTNGTYLNEVRITGRVPVKKSDSITLGLTVRMPWPTEAGAPRVAVLRVGRDPDNDFVIALPVVSGHHARVFWSDEPGLAVIEDLGSANGTAVGSPDRKAARSMIRAGETLYFGTHAVPARDLLARLAPAVVPPVAERSNTLREGVLTKEVRSSNPPLPLSRASELPWSLVRQVRLLALLLQAPLLALAIGAGFGSNLAAEGRLASVLSSLSLASLWFGLSDAAIGDLLGPRGPGRREGGPLDLTSFSRRLGMMVILGIVQCSMAWTIVSKTVGLGGRWLPAVALLSLAWAVGMALGCLIVEASPRPRVAWAAIALAMVMLWLFGGGPQSLTPRASWSRVISNAVPSRWAFEGLLLLETDQAATGEGLDPAEAYFPAETERMGILADVLALGLMLIGLSGAVAGFIVLASRPRDPAGPLASSAA